MRKPRVGIHWAGVPEGGGPAMLANRLVATRLTKSYDLVPMHQVAGAGGINLRMIRSWAEFLRRERVEFLQVAGLGNEGFHAAAAAHWARVPSLLVVHGTVRDLRLPPSKTRAAILSGLMEPISLALATRVATVSAHSQNRRFIERHQAKLLPPLINGTPVMTPISATERTEIRRSLGVDEGTVLGLCVGRLSVEKGHEYLSRGLSRSAEQLRRARFHLLIAGSGPDETLIREGYEAVSDLVTFLGPRADVERLLQASGIFLFPSLHENLSLALLEAMSAGTAIVASDIPGNREALGDTGYLVEAASGRGISEGLLRLLDDPGERRRLGEMARVRHGTTYSLDSMVARYEAAYRQMLSSPRVGSN